MVGSGNGGQWKWWAVEMVGSGNGGPKYENGEWKLERIEK